MVPGKWYKGNFPYRKEGVDEYVALFVGTDGSNNTSKSIMPLFQYKISGEGSRIRYSSTGEIWVVPRTNAHNEVPDPFNGRVRHYCNHYRKPVNERHEFMWLSLCGHDVEITTDNKYLVTCKHCLSLMGDLFENFEV